MLKCKPRVGEVLEYRCYDVCREYVVTRFEDNLMWTEDQRDGEFSLFIWKRHNGEMNTLLFHKED